MTYPIQFFFTSYMNFLYVKITPEFSFTLNDVKFSIVLRQIEKFELGWCEMFIRYTFITALLNSSSVFSMCNVGVCSSLRRV